MIRYRWEDNIKRVLMDMVCEVMDWIPVAQGKGASLAFVYSAMSLTLCAEFLDHLFDSLLLKLCLVELLSYKPH